MKFRALPQHFQIATVAAVWMTSDLIDLMVRNRNIYLTASLRASAFTTASVYIDSTPVPALILTTGSLYSSWFCGGGQNYVASVLTGFLFIPLLLLVTKHTSIKSNYLQQAWAVFLTLLHALTIPMETREVSPILLAILITLASIIPVTMRITASMLLLHSGLKKHHYLCFTPLLVLVFIAFIANFTANSTYQEMVRHITLAGITPSPFGTYILFGLLLGAAQAPEYFPLHKIVIAGIVARSHQLLSGSRQSETDEMDDTTKVRKALRKLREESLNAIAHEPRQFAECVLPLLCEHTETTASAISITSKESILRMTFGNIETFPAAQCESALGYGPSDRIMLWGRLKEPERGIVGRHWFTLMTQAGAPTGNCSKYAMLLMCGLSDLGEFMRTLYTAYDKPAPKFAPDVPQAPLPAAALRRGLHHGITVAHSTGDVRAVITVLAHKPIATSAAAPYATVLDAVAEDACASQIRSSVASERNTAEAKAAEEAASHHSAAYNLAHAVQPALKKLAEVTGSEVVEGVLDYATNVVAFSRLAAGLSLSPPEVINPVEDLLSALQSAKLNPVVSLAVEQAVPLLCEVSAVVFGTAAPAVVRACAAHVPLGAEISMRMAAPLALPEPSHGSMYLSNYDDDDSDPRRRLISLTIEHEGEPFLFEDIEALKRPMSDTFGQYQPAAITAEVPPAFEALPLATRLRLPVACGITLAAKGAFEVNTCGSVTQVAMTVPVLTDSRGQPRLPRAPRRILILSPYTREAMLLKRLLESVGCEVTHTLSLAGLAFSDALIIDGTFMEELQNTSVAVDCGVSLQKAVILGGSPDAEEWTKEARRVGTLLARPVSQQQLFSALREAAYGKCIVSGTFTEGPAMGAFCEVGDEVGDSGSEPSVSPRGRTQSVTEQTNVSPEAVIRRASYIPSKRVASHAAVVVAGPMSKARIAVERCAHQSRLPVTVLPIDPFQIQDELKFLSSGSVLCFMDVQDYEAAITVARSVLDGASRVVLIGIGSPQAAEEAELVDAGFVELIPRGNDRIAERAFAHHLKAVR